MQELIDKLKAFNVTAYEGRTAEELAIERQLQEKFTAEDDRTFKEIMESYDNTNSNS